MNFRKPRAEDPEINLIPFIDVLLVVLIFLMLSTTYSKFTELQVSLPTAEAEKMRERPAEIIVAVSGDGRYAVNRTAINGRSVEALAAALGAAARALAASPPPPSSPPAQGEVEIVVRYDGADLAEVAAMTGLDPAEVVRAHTSTLWRVAFGGFVPGFGYLVGGDPRLQVPRRESPRTRVPAGSVALAGEFTGVYPRASPGGWQLIGTTDAVLWDPDRSPPAVLTPGTRVRFVDIEASR